MDSTFIGSTPGEQALGVLVPAIMAIVLPIIIHLVKKFSFWPEGYNLAVPLNALLSVGITLIVAPWIGLALSKPELIILGMAVATGGQTVHWVARVTTKKNGG